LALSGVLPPTLHHIWSLLAAVVGAETTAAAAALVAILQALPLLLLVLCIQLPSVAVALVFLVQSKGTVRQTHPFLGRA
jgi:hypothetical protein